MAKALTKTDMRRASFRPKKGRTGALKRTDKRFAAPQGSVDESSSGSINPAIRDHVKVDGTAAISPVHGKGGAGPK